MYVNPVVTGATLPAAFRKWAVVPPHPLSVDPATISANRTEWIKEWTDLVVR
jgi:thiamine transport system substrate-binding protein